MGLCSCLASCLAYPALEPEGSLALRRIPPGECMPITILWGQEFSGGPASRILHSHSGGLSLNPDQWTKSPQATHCSQRKQKEKRRKQITPKTKSQNQTKHTVPTTQHSQRRKNRRKQLNRHAKSKTNGNNKTKQKQRGRQKRVKGKKRENKELKNENNP